VELLKFMEEGLFWDIDLEIGHNAKNLKDGKIGLFDLDSRALDRDEFMMLAPHVL
jgi:hypothetical protein